MVRQAHHERAGAMNTGPIFPFVLSLSKGVNETQAPRSYGSTGSPRAGWGHEHGPYLSVRPELVEGHERDPSPPAHMVRQAHHERAGAMNTGPIFPFVLSLSKGMNGNQAPRSYGSTGSPRAGGTNGQGDHERAGAHSVHTSIKYGAGLAGVGMCRAPTPV